MLRGIRERWRFRWFVARQGLDFYESFLRTSYRIYLNHDKIIHVRDGYPVYSLSTPAVFSKPAANMMARLLYKTLQSKNLPNMMSFAVNDVCDAHCPHCSFFAGVAQPGRPVLTTAQAEGLIRDAQALGVSVLNVVGGEPLLRDDLPAIVRSVEKSLTTTILYTNGSRLAERIGELRRAGLDSVYASLDFADARRHDRFRGVPGLFDRVVTGLDRARSLGLSTGISCTITPESFAAGELTRLIELGRRLGVHELLVFDAMPTGRYSGRADLIDNPAWVEAMIEAVKPFNQDPRYPGILVWAYTAGYRAVGCACGTNYFYVSPYGDVMPCDFNHAVFGNVLERPLYEIWDDLTSRDEYHQAKWGGCKIKDSRFRALPTVVAGPIRRRAADHQPATIEPAPSP
jgi:MoaA/NifB/PqqE/SkfB family radical SAM enzyme